MKLPNLPLEEALQLVHFYAKRGSPKFERAVLHRSLTGSGGDIRKTQRPW